MARLRLCEDVVSLVARVQVVVEALRQVDREVAEQLHRASRSVALNTWEGGASRGGNRRALLERAYASAHECMGCVKIGCALGYVPELEAAEVLRQLDSVAARLWTLCHRPR